MALIGMGDTPGGPFFLLFFFFSFKKVDGHMITWAFTSSLSLVCLYRIVRFQEATIPMKNNRVSPVVVIDHHMLQARHFPLQTSES